MQGVLEPVRAWPGVDVDREVKQAGPRLDVTVMVQIRFAQPTHPSVAETGRNAACLALRADTLTLGPRTPAEEGHRAT